MEYKRPPITEAVIELRFAHPLDEATVQIAAKRVRGEYTFEEPEVGQHVHVDVSTKSTQFRTLWTGLKLSSVDRADIAIFRSNSFTCSRLAPYSGWEAFQPRAARDWDALKKTAGPIELARIGVRYINRIDVPLMPNVLISVEDYLSVWPHSPDDIGEAMTGYAMQILRPLGVDDFGLIVNSAIVPSPLIGFASFLLDLDVYRENALPRRDDELWSILEQMRHHKNRIFESCITERARAIFNQ
jgi:uncharacterized protein (TIGR04255 family)